MMRIAIAFLLVASTSNASAADYTGFWKERCDEAYGLQIKPYREGTYTVTFCGPGDPHCTKPVDPSTATTIDGDDDYEVLGPDRIRVVHSTSYKPLYSKCTSDPHPLLEYSATDRTAQAQGLVLFIVFHLAYFGLAVLGYRHLYRRMQSLPPSRRRVYRTLAAAVLFSPGMHFSWPVASPTFALIAVALHAISIPFVGVALLPAQLLFTLGPIAVVWALLFAVAQARAQFARAR